MHIHKAVYERRGRSVSYNEKSHYNRWEENDYEGGNVIFDYIVVFPIVIFFLQKRVREMYSLKITTDLISSCN